MQYKYLEIELSNQMVLLRKRQRKKRGERTADDVIRVDDAAIQKEYMDSQFFRGSIIPPQDSWSLDKVLSSLRVLVPSITDKTRIFEISDFSSFRISIQIIGPWYYGKLESSR